MFGFFGGNKGSSKPTVKQIVTQLKLPDRDMSWKKAKKEIKSVLPYITKEELVEVHTQFKDQGGIQVRLSKKEAGLFSTLVLHKSQQRLVPREEYTCCDGNLCGNGCAIEVQSSKFMGPTDLGIVPVPVEGGGGGINDAPDFVEVIDLEEGGLF